MKKVSQVKLGHQAPKGYRDKNFNSIEINGDFAYCKSHNFVYQPNVQEKLLYNGQPCFYTDIRYIDGNFNFFKNMYLHWTRVSSISLKACIRRVLKCRNIPVGTIVNFKKSWYISNKNIDLSYKFKVRRENSFNPDYQINNPEYSDNFKNCDFSKELTNRLRENGFIVSVTRNESFLSNIINTAIAYTGESDYVDSAIEGEIAIAYGHNKKIGFSSKDNDFMGYSNGKSNILYDFFGCFDKWSRCNEILKSTNIDDIIKELLSEEESENL